MALTTFEVAGMKLSVPVNGLFTHFKRLPDNVRRFCRPLLFHRDSSPYELAYSGSSLMFRHRGRNLQLATKHQLRMRGQPDLDPADACMVLQRDDRNIGISPISATRLNAGFAPDATVEDILLLEFGTDRAGQDISPHFLSLDLDVTPGLSELAPERVRYIFSIGYPTKDQGYEPVFNDGFELIDLGIISRWGKVILQPRERTSWDLDTRIPLRVHERTGEIGDPDGWSGAPVFFVWLDQSNIAQLGFAGMVTHGDGSNFGIYPGEEIRRIVDQVLRLPPPPGEQ